MEIKFLIDEDIVNYKKISMFIGFPECSFKCDKECGRQVCQNRALAQQESIHIEMDQIVERYLESSLTEAIIIGGLEPFDSAADLLKLISKFREKTEDDIVIYSGYYPQEVPNELEQLKKYKNIIVKFGRYIPDKPKKYDDVLGVELASDYQWAERLS